MSGSRQVGGSVRELPPAKEAVGCGARSGSAAVGASTCYIAPVHNRMTVRYHKDGAKHIAIYNVSDTDNGDFGNPLVTNGRALQPSRPDCGHWTPLRRILGLRCGRPREICCQWARAQGGPPGRRAKGSRADSTVHAAPAVDAAAVDGAGSETGRVVPRSVFRVAWANSTR